MFWYNWVAGDIIALAFTYGVILSILKFLEESAKMELFDLNVLRKLCHVMIGLTLMLCWPLFSSGRTGAILASLIPGLVTTRGLIVGLGMGKDEKIIRSLSRYRNSRELLKATMGYVSTITLATAIYWRTSPAAIAAICNLCAGDGIADIAGRRFGSWKLPYNRNKSIVGTTAMATCTCSIFRGWGTFKKVQRWFLDSS
ncbi:farnesol kinase, chloroplastic-like isoform X2 [Olea europaea var. sylvestris]|uniref:farnesol kinase, chloroplastic-like isoform X2 n=1 Tax=Olea europaea var. sylvestris TaxID=158386 RepID=UPI000C1CEF89|nr:farnesol kinase, chloroplastic-like isoform X2 [Olea europaea var. sylvestris]